MHAADGVSHTALLPVDTGSRQVAILADGEKTIQ